MRVTLAQWARQQDPPWPLSTAYNRYHRGALPEHIQRRAVQTASGSIEIEFDDRDLGDAAARLDVPRLVQALEDAGWVVLTAAEADQLGVRRAHHRNNDTEEAEPCRV